MLPMYPAAGKWMRAFRRPKSAIDHGEYLKKAVKGPPMYNGWEYCVYYEYLFRESATFSVRLA